MKRALTVTLAFRNQCLAKAEEAVIHAGNAEDREYRAKWKNVSDIWRYIAAQPDGSCNQQ